MINPEAIEDWLKGVHYAEYVHTTEGLDALFKLTKDIDTNNDFDWGCLDYISQIKGKL